MKNKKPLLYLREKAAKSKLLSIKEDVLCSRQKQSPVSEEMKTYIRSGQSETHKGSINEDHYAEGRRLYTQISQQRTEGQDVPGING